MQYSENNDITAEGMKMLTKREWGNIISSNLSKNKIGNIGLRYISRSIWTSLAILKLSKDAIN